jgi:predicted phosphodiesterase
MPGLVIETLPPCAGRTLLIGDVHGCADELETLLEVFAPGPGDRLLAVGDLINRGPDSRRVLDLARHHGIRAVLGNHELRLLAAWRAGNPDALKARDRPTFAALRETDWTWIQGWPHVLSIPAQALLVVHGGFVPGAPWREQDADTVTSVQVLDNANRPRKRNDLPAGRPWAVTWNGPEHVVYGHTPRPQVLRHKLATGIDTGCVYGYTLSALSLPDGGILRVPARRRYVGD